MRQIRLAFPARAFMIKLTNLQRRKRKPGVSGVAGMVVAGLGRLNDGVCRVCTALIMFLLVAIVVILFGSVFWRYVFNDPISWSEDAALLCMVWMALLGAPVGLRRGGHVAMEMMLNMFPPQVIKGLRALISLIVLATAVVVVMYGGGFVKQGFARIIPSMDWLSQGYVYLALPVGFALLIPICLEDILRSLSAARPAPVED